MKNVHDGDGYPRNATRDYWVQKIDKLMALVMSLKAENTALKERLAQIQNRFFDDGK